LKSDDNTVTGTMLGIDGKEKPIVDGKLDGDNISLTVATEWQGNPMKLFVKGKISGEQMQINIAADNGYWSTDARNEKAFTLRFSRREFQGRARLHTLRKNSPPPENALKGLGFQPRRCSDRRTYGAPEGAPLQGY
jgi:hypothetical protein